MNSNEEQEIIRLFEDVGEMERIYAEDYVQSDESGRLFTRADLIRNLASGKIRFLSMKSTGRRVRVFGDFAVVHGSEEDEIERAGENLSVKYVYMDAVVRRGGHWQIVASQLAKL